MSAALIGRIVGLAFLAGARPFLTIAMAQTVVLLAVYANWVSLHPDYAALLSWPVVTAVFVLAVLELIVAHDGDADEIKRLTQLDKIGGVAATAYGTLLMFAMGEPVPESVSAFSSATAAMAATPQSEVASLLEQTTAMGHPLWLQGAAVVSAATLTLVLAWVRGWILEWLTDVGVDGLWHIAETGGVPLAVLLVLFAPLVMLVAVVGATLLMAVFAVAARAWQKRTDTLARVHCAHCRQLVRSEASLCPHCRRRLTPQKWLGQEERVGPVPASAAIG